MKGFASSRSLARIGPPPPVAIARLAACLAACAVLSGCGGCRREPQDEAEKKRQEEEAKRPPLELGRLLTLPYESNPEFCAYKPGHWTATVLPARANKFDLLGDLETAVVNTRGESMPLVGVKYSASTSREITLAKGRAKVLRSALFVPDTGQDAFADSQIRGRRGARETFGKSHPLRQMPSYQYHFVVLARWPLTYSHLARLDCFKRPFGLLESGLDQGFYRVHLMRGDQRPALPAHSLFWTSIAYLLWDDAAPGALDLDQRTALLDWLHWGGQIIVSGPESLDALADSFFTPVLPAASGGTRSIVQADLDAINRRWNLPASGKPPVQLAQVQPWTGVKLDLHPEARFVPGTGNLVAERRVGRGRVIVTAFDLSQPDLVKWPGYDGFFNACLLRRPPRKFEPNGFEVQVKWSDPRLGPFDAEQVTQLRYFTRDAGAAPKRITSNPPGAPSAIQSGGSAGADMAAPGELEHASTRGPGVSAWSDFNVAADTAREALQAAARIEIPDRMFVVWVVGIYLVILVPANWIVFRAIHRIEWAWAAAPLIALVYTGIVIRMAQLDVGFARSITEIGVVELQGDYPRAHLTRYTALYTSLATGYEVRLDDDGALVQPFPTVPSPERLNYLMGEKPERLQYRYGKGVRMRGLRVRSNSTELVHSEQMIDLAGGMELTRTPNRGWQLINHTPLTVRGAGVVRRTDRGRVETAWIGTLEPDNAVVLRFDARPQTDVAGRLWGSERNRESVTTAGEMGQLRIGALIDLAVAPEFLRPPDAQAADGGSPRPGNPGAGRPGDPRELRPGGVRLVGWLDDALPGLAIRPAAPQTRYATVVVAHLRRGFGDDPRPDVNRPADVQEDDRFLSPDDLEAEFP